MIAPMFVVRPIPGVDAAPGDVVETDGMPNAAALSRTRYLRPLLASEVHLLPGTEVEDDGPDDTTANGGTASRPTRASSARKER